MYPLVHVALTWRLLECVAPLQLVLDRAPELSGRVVEALTDLLQAKQTSPVPYRPALLGLVERFHCSWKDIVAIFVAEAQNDWDRWLSCAVYAYAGARHSAIGFSPNELMMGRQLRAPNDLLQTMGETQIGEFTEYRRGLVRHMARSAEMTKAALAKDQQRRAKYYNRQERRTTESSVGDLVWVLRPPRGKGITKLAHQWVGPARIVEGAGFDNWRVLREDTDEHLVVHCSFIMSGRCPGDSLGHVAERILRELAKEEGGSTEDSEEDNGVVPDNSVGREVMTVDDSGATTRPITDCEARMSGRRLTAGGPEDTAATQARNSK
ncbi:unnamed protein product [Phytophthora fragariaefolia]|uniref:Unnamed protein product n=1 Tax=Phytophthora fragariaefolia TaxID=1490495 RepID=A0A9W7D6W4_9STRA|nr:unnamed protein product [Phytophthora fragariaefolia]